MRLKPHISYQFCVRYSQLAASTERVLWVKIILVKTKAEILGQLYSVAQALKTTVHEASIAKILQPSDSSSSCLRDNGVEVFRHKLTHAKLWLLNFS